MSALQKPAYLCAQLQEKEMVKRDKDFGKEVAAVSKQAAETAKRAEQLAKQEAEVCRDGQAQGLEDPKQVDSMPLSPLLALVKGHE